MSLETILSYPIHAANPAVLVGQSLRGFSCNGAVRHKFVASSHVRRLAIQSNQCPLCGASFTDDELMRKREQELRDKADRISKKQGKKLEDGNI